MRWAKSHEIVIKMLRVGGHAAFWENLWAKAGPNRASIDSPEKRICWITNYNSFIGQGRT